jgi:hypothetical protein
MSTSPIDPDRLDERYLVDTLAPYGDDWVRLHEVVQEAKILATVIRDLLG